MSVSAFCIACIGTKPSDACFIHDTRGVLLSQFSPVPAGPCQAQRPNYRFFARCVHGTYSNTLFLKKRDTLFTPRLCVCACAFVCVCVLPGGKGLQPAIAWGFIVQQARPIKVVGLLPPRPPLVSVSLQRRDAWACAQPLAL